MTDKPELEQEAEKGLHTITKGSPAAPPPGRCEPEKRPEPPPESATNGSEYPGGAVAPPGRGPGHPPSLARQAWNLARSLADFVVDGCKTVTKKQYENRLEICDACEQRLRNRCTKCGCRLSLKAQGRAFQCPEGKWPAVDCDEQEK